MSAMLRIDEELLNQVGLSSLPAADKNDLLAQIYQMLEVRVGMHLASQMTEAQLDEFEVFMRNNDQPGALQWLESNFPHYKQVVADQLEKLKAEVKRDAPEILRHIQAGQGSGLGDPSQFPPEDNQ